MKKTKLNNGAYTCPQKSRELFFSLTQGWASKNSGTCKETIHSPPKFIVI